MIRSGYRSTCIWCAILLSFACRHDADDLPPAESISVPTAIEGRVMAAGKPIAGARVCVKGQATSVISDSRGAFLLPLPNESVLPTIVTAAEPNHFIGSSRFEGEPIQIELQAVPELDDETYEWVDPRPDDTASHNCANCHQQIFEQWSQDGHAHAARNRRFLNLYDGSDWQGQADRGWSLRRDHPLGQGVCLACHAPAAKLQQLATGDIRQIDSVAQQGVHCDFCHKIQQVAEGTIGLSHGRFGVSLLRPEHGQLFFGPLPDVDRGEDVYSPLMKKSQYCAACHEGIVFGVHVYSTFSEWQQSPAARAGKQCQDCHMQGDGQMNRIAETADAIERDPDTLSSHRFLSGGRETMLRNSLSVDVETERQGGELICFVTVVADKVGHRVPTGFVDRHLLLVVEGRDADGRSVPIRSGPRLDRLAGNLADVPGKLFAKRLLGEPPRSPAPIPFWGNVVAVEDTRLVPEQPDRSRYVFADKLASVRVRVIYRRFWYDVARQKGWPDDEIVVFDRELRVERS